jgi:hypothetical protein
MWRAGRQKKFFFYIFHSSFSFAAVAILFHQMTTRWKCAKELASSCWANSLPSSMQNEFFSSFFLVGLSQGFGRGSWLRFGICWGKGFGGVGGSSRHLKEVEDN